MSASFDPGRRRLLLAAAGLAASAALGPRAIGLVLERLGATGEVAQALRGLVSHPESAALLGRSYLAATPGEASATRLSSLILGERAVPAARASARVASQIQADFDHGRVVTVDRWILSRTEARLCALCALA